MTRTSWHLLATLLVSSGLLFFASVSDGQNGGEKTSGPKADGQKDDGRRSGNSTDLILLEETPTNSIQIKALKQGQATVFEIQLGGGSNQPPSNTQVTGKATATVGEKKYAGYFRLATEAKMQLRMKLVAAGKKPGVDKDQYSFLFGYDVLKFEFASTSTFANPWLTGQITNVTATQQVPNQDNGNEHPPVLLSGKISAPTGGSLAKEFGSGDTLLTLNVGGNQRLADLELGNTLSGMKLQQGKYTPYLMKSLRKE